MGTKKAKTGRVALGTMALVLAACAPQQGGAPSPTAVDPSMVMQRRTQQEFGGQEALAAFGGYREWHKANPKPVVLGNMLDMLCRNLTAEEQMLRKSDPHADYPPWGLKTFTVYVNDAGWRRMAGQDKGAFPVGTIIVKEKHLGKDEQSSEMLTAMVKREKGFLPAVGDWEFFVLGGMAKRLDLRGMPKNCVACHTTVKGNDFVYADYLPKQKVSGD